MQALPWAHYCIIIGTVELRITTVLISTNAYASNVYLYPPLLRYRRAHCTVQAYYYL